MKRNILSIALTAMAVCATTVSAQKPFKLQGTQAENVKNIKYYVYVADEKFQLPDTPTDSVEVKKGQFSYKSTLAEPRMMLFQGKVDDKTISMNRYQFYAVPGESAQLEIKGDEYFLTGSEFYEQWNGADQCDTKAKKAVMDVITNAQGLEAALAGKTEEEQNAMIEKVQSDYMAAYMSYCASDSAYLVQHNKELGTVAFFALNSEDYESTLKRIDPSVLSTPYGQLIQQRADMQKKQAEARAAAEKAAAEAGNKTGEGKMFVDFEAEYDGKVAKLSDYVGKGKYILVDFWASWCGPCKAEIPNIINVYNAHKGDKFDVLGVATWDKPEATKKAIEQLGIPYQQMLNAQRAGSDAYGIMGIPEIILFGPDGTILKRGLRGDDIEKTVSEYLSK